MMRIAATLGIAFGFALIWLAIDTNYSGPVIMALCGGALIGGGLAVGIASE